ncbi:MAG: single-stranded DNA-binding protein [Burkholderiaceae bacterium]|nr:single-stranded DNA-binding protein [Burkholderiaceae bacterium]
MLYAQIVGYWEESATIDADEMAQGYSFRGIDDVYNALAPVMAKHGLVIMPRILSRELTERASAKGGVLFSVVVEAEFDFVSSHDGSKHTVKTYGEAMDSADKATNKAMSAAYKYAAFQTFCIPTEGDNDADAVTHVVQRVIDRQQTVSPENYEATTLAALRSAALSGQEALIAAFQRIAPGYEKDAFWNKHGESLSAYAVDMEIYESQNLPILREAVPHRASCRAPDRQKHARIYVCCYAMGC